MTPGQPQLQPAPIPAALLQANQCELNYAVIINQITPSELLRPSGGLRLLLETSGNPPNGLSLSNEVTGINYPIISKSWSFSYNIDIHTPPHTIVIKVARGQKKEDYVLQFYNQRNGEQVGQWLRAIIATIHTS